MTKAAVTEVTVVEGGKAKEVLENINTVSPVIRPFLLYATALDNKRDQYERAMKISRDITIESKRIIFLLHTLDRDSKLEVILVMHQSVHHSSYTDHGPFRVLRRTRSLQLEVVGRQSLHPPPPTATQQM